MLQFTMEKTLQHYIDAGHVRYMPEYLRNELAQMAPNCLGTAAEQLHWVIRGISDYPLCKACDTRLSSFHWEPYLKPALRDDPNVKSGYRPFCGRSCAYLHGTKKENFKKTSMKRYGVEHPMQNEEIISGIKQRNREKYGVPNPNMWSGELFGQNLFKKHGTPIVRHIDGVHEKIALAKRKASEELLSKKITEIEELFEVKCLATGEFSTRVDEVELTWKHTCGQIWDSNISFRGIRQCPRCWNGTSKGEQAIALFLQEQGARVVQRDRQILAPRELDIFLPEHKLAIEFDGTYWHSAKFESKKKCVEKLESCSSLGIQLITIQEHIWVQNPEGVKARLLSLIGKTEKVGARKTRADFISTSMATEFLKGNHMQGSAKSSVAVGLFLKTELVAVATFGKPRWDKKHEWELIRMAFKQGMTVQGGASKLIKAFQDEHSGSIISYADRCWSTGNVYKQLGFEFSHNATPSYWWVHHTLGTYSRYQTQKAKLPMLLGGLKKEFRPELSEEDNMRRAGFLPLFDRGNSVWILKQT